MRALVNNYASDNQDFDSTDIGDGGTGALLIGKLVQADFKLHKTYSQARNQKWADSEKVKDYLFMGAGWHSIVAKNKLHRRIDCAVSALGGMQQNGGMGTEFNEEYDKKDRQTLKDVALDVLTALGLTVDDLK
jgi:hypothetical protein